MAAFYSWSASLWQPSGLNFPDYNSDESHFMCGSPFYQSHRFIDAIEKKEFDRFCDILLKEYQEKNKPSNAPKKSDIYDCFPETNDVASLFFRFRLLIVFDDKQPITVREFRQRITQFHQDHRVEFVPLGSTQPHIVIWMYVGPPGKGYKQIFKSRYQFNNLLSACCFLNLWTITRDKLTYMFKEYYQHQETPRLTKYVLKGNMFEVLEDPCGQGVDLMGFFCPGIQSSLAYISPCRLLTEREMILKPSRQTRRQKRKLITAEPNQYLLDPMIHSYVLPAIINNPTSVSIKYATLPSYFDLKLPKLYLEVWTQMLLDQEENIPFPFNQEQFVKWISLLRVKFSLMPPSPSIDPRLLDSLYNGYYLSEPEVLTRVSDDVYPKKH